MSTVSVLVIVKSKDLAIFLRRMIMSWTDSWEQLNSIEGGAQGDCFKVKRKNGDETPFFLKQLKDGGSKERRRRFSLETIIHKTFKIPQTTDILETNAEEWEDKNVSLYYVAHYVSGERLDKYVESNSLTELDIIGLFSQLLKILINCDENEIVHRDVKPENIIICDSGLHLVDFGIASSSLIKPVTKTGQEIGNRFLRLPEFAAGSSNKRDVRSDITLACAIALYLISGTYPRVLQNEDGAYPHQIAATQEKVSSLENNLLWNAIFDRAFIPRLSSRWVKSEEIITILEKMNMTDKTEIGAMKAQLSALLAVHMQQSLSQLSKDMHIVFKMIEPIVNQVCNENSQGFNIRKSAWVYNRGDVIKRTQIRFHEIGNMSKYVSVVLSAELLGEQIVSYIAVGENKAEISRAPTNATPELISIDKEIIERKILSGLIAFKSA